jgi:hypothetical protein
MEEILPAKIEVSQIALHLLRVIKGFSARCSRLALLHRALPGVAI